MSEAVRFGTLPDGRVVRRLRLAWPGGLEADILEYGAILRSLTVPAAGGRIETVVGFDDLSTYVEDRGYFGCVVGRVANRIAGARFDLDGLSFPVTANEGANCLHGGALGLGKRLWRFEDIAADGRSVTLAYVSPHGEEGFPGTLSVRVRFELTAPDSLTIAWDAETDRSTPVNLTHHLYFNLAGDAARPAFDHELMVAADAFTPVGPGLIPTGVLQSVDGSPFDLRRPRRLGDALAEAHPQLRGGFDHNWVLRAAATPAVALRFPRTGAVLELQTDQPGVQIYTGDDRAAPHAIAIEPQGFPDAVHQPGFPDPIVRPGTPYARRATYRLRAGAPGLR